MKAIVLDGCSGLDQLSVFQGFDPDQLVLLRQLFMFFFMPKGTLIFEQGDAAEYFYILVDGEVDIRYKPDDGPPLVITHVRPEGVVGWSAAIGNPEYTSSAICSLDSKILRVRGLNLRKFYEMEPQTGAMFLEKLATLIEARLRSTHPQLMDLLEHSFALKLDQPAAAG
jgi:CRP/FNR family transcriptional regulator, cyclic AMP receptor protein